MDLSDVFKDCLNLLEFLLSLGHLAADIQYGHGRLMTMTTITMFPRQQHVTSLRITGIAPVRFYLPCSMSDLCHFQIYPVRLWA